MMMVALEVQDTQDTQANPKDLGASAHQLPVAPPGPCASSGGRTGAGTCLELGKAGPLTIFRLIGQPAVLGILVDVVGVALGTLLGPEVLVGPRTVVTVADLVFKHGS